MATNTLNYKLKKPAQTDFYNIEDQNGNMDVIDAELKKVNDNVTALGETVATHLADEAHVRWLGTAGGTANALTATHSEITSYKDGLGVSFAVSVDATGATTLKINNLTAIPIKKANGNGVTNLKKNGVYTVRYSTGAFILQGEGGSGDATPNDIRLGKTASTDNGDIIGALDLSEAKPENIKEGVSIGGIVGTLSPASGAINKDIRSIQNVFLARTNDATGRDYYQTDDGGYFAFVNSSPPRIYRYDGNNNLIEQIDVSIPWTLGGTSIFEYNTLAFISLTMSGKSYVRKIDWKNNLIGAYDFPTSGNQIGRSYFELDNKPILARRDTTRDTIMEYIDEVGNVLASATGASGEPNNSNQISRKLEKDVVINSFGGKSQIIYSRYPTLTFGVYGITVGTYTVAETMVKMISALANLGRRR